jgi:hypothetical protein
VFALLPGSRGVRLTEPLPPVKTGGPPNTPEQPPEHNEKKDNQEKPK